MFEPTTRVLVVDDMPAMRQLVKGECKKLGFRTLHEAENGREGWNVLETQYDMGQPIQLVLSDWNMPIMTGIALLEMVRKTPQYKDLPFLLITAEGEQRQVLQAIQGGVSNYLVKPFTPASFKQKIELVWKKHNPMAATLARAGGAAPAKPGTPVKK